MFLNYSSNYRHPPSIAARIFPSLITGFQRSWFPGFQSVLWGC